MHSPFETNVVHWMIFCVWPIVIRSLIHANGMQQPPPDMQLNRCSKHRATFKKWQCSHWNAHSAFSIQSTSVYFMNLTNANECEEHSHVLFTISPISHFCHVTRSHHVNLSVARIFSFLMMLFFVSDHCISFCLMQHDVASVVTVFFKWSLYACIQQLNVELSNFSIQIYELKVPFVQCKLWLMT